MAMTNSDGFLTTHTGSLPRPERLMRMMFAREEDVPVEAEALDRAVAEAVALMVDRQVAAGIAIVGDGEMSKPSYATYIKDRLDGFGGESGSYSFQDLDDFPGTRAKVFGDAGRARRRAPACTGPISVRDMEAPRLDAERLVAAAAGRPTFMSAASPGVTALFFRNEYYPDHESYLFALADGLRHEYETIAAAGITLQIDCPDLAMGRHVQYAHLDLAGFRTAIGLHVAALNHAVANIPADRLRMHLCWGNYPGPHHCDVPLADIIDIVWTAKPSAILFEAANPRHAHEHALFEAVKVPEDKILVPGLIEPQSTYIEHPELIAQRLSRYANLVGRERVIAGVDCGFSIHVGSGGLDPEVVWAKLAALAEGAAIASRRF
ncbi:cobalamin-independent methionine synthase II family protein [Sphingosinicella terrae]|uniref:cobalamin-independent methionine synthase II family protein n=1 Tax=Sphingosinicella terrae TaxID=2172047 RepID=UPI000E0DFBE7|nr:cobalamin-independent methionine synthase II family protein [Sphingosinicella terrae]